MSIGGYLLRKEVDALRIPERGLDSPYAQLYKDEHGYNFDYGVQTPGGTVDAKVNLGNKEFYSNLPPGFSFRQDTPLTSWDCVRNPGSDSCKVPPPSDTGFNINGEYSVSGCKICLKITQQIGVIQIGGIICYTRANCQENQNQQTQPPHQPIEIPPDEDNAFNKIPEIPYFPTQPYEIPIQHGCPPGTWIKFRYTCESPHGWAVRYRQTFDLGKLPNEELEIEILDPISYGLKIIDTSYNYGGYCKGFVGGFYFKGKGIRGQNRYAVYNGIVTITIPFGNFQNLGFSFRDGALRCWDDDPGGKIWYSPSGWYLTNIEAIEPQCALPPEKSKPPYPATDIYPKREDNDMSCCGCDCQTISLISARNTKQILDALSNIELPDSDLVKKIHDGLGIQYLPSYHINNYLEENTVTTSPTILGVLETMILMEAKKSKRIYKELGLDKLPYINLRSSSDPNVPSLRNATSLSELNKYIHDLLIEYAHTMHEKQGIDEYPIQVPKSLMVKVGDEASSQTREINNFPEYMTYVVTQLYDVLGGGSFPTEIKIEDSDLTQEGNQEKIVPVPNMAEAILQILANSLTTQVDNTALMNIATSTLIEAGSIKQVVTGIDHTTKASAEFLDFDMQEAEEELPLLFTPGALKLEDFVKNSTQKFKVWENVDKTTLSNAIRDIKEILAVVNGVFRRKINMNGNIAEQVVGFIKGAASILDGKESEEESTDDFSNFTERVERGFTDSPGITDPLSYYGRPYEERPQIRDIDKRTDTGDDSNG